MNDRLNRPARLREACAVIGGFVALTLAMTYPVVTHMTTALPNDLGDPLLNAWILAWDSDRMLHGLRGLWQAPVFYPYADTLAYSEHLLGIAVIFAPVQWLFGNFLLTYNVAFLFAYVLAGCGTYLLVKSLTGNRWAAWIAGIAFAFCPYRAAQIPHLQMLTSGWMPLGLWALHRYFAQGSRRALLGFSAAFLLQALSNGYSLYFFAVPVAVIVVDEAVLALTCAALFAVRDNAVRYVARGADAPPLAASAASLLGASTVVLLYLLIVRRHGLRVKLRAALPAFGAAGVTLGLAYASLVEGFDRGRVSVVAPLNATQSLWAVLLAAVLIGRSEHIGRRTVLSGVLVLAGGATISVLR
jgi:uncharacterized membrane protein